MNVLHMWLHVQSVLLGIILLASLFFNGLLMKVLWMKMKSKRCKGDATSNNIERIYTYLLYHLAFSDILSVLLNIPFDIFLHTEVVVIYMSHIGCQILPPFQLASTTAQAGTYVALSYHRFRAIVHPFSATVTGYKSFIMITLIWFVSVGLSIPYVMVNRFNATSSECYENWGRKSKTLYTFSIFIVQYGFPVSLMALFYIAIARTLQNHRTAKEKVRVPSRDDERCHRRIVKMLVTIVTVYSVCMLPHHVFWIFTSIHPNVDQSASKIVESVSYLFTYSNTVANPIVFFIYNTESHHYLKRMSRKFCCGQTMNITFELEKWSISWSGATKSDSPRSFDTKTTNDEHKLKQLFPPKPSDSDVGVSLPWEAQILNSPELLGYREYSSSTHLKHSQSMEEPMYASDLSNPLLLKDIPNDVVQAGCRSDNDESESKGSNAYDYRTNTSESDEVFFDQTVEVDHDHCFDRIDVLGHPDEHHMTPEEPSNKIRWNEATDGSEYNENEVSLVSAVIDEMMRDVREELNREVVNYNFLNFEDILNLSEKSREYVQSGRNLDRQREDVRDIRQYQESEEDEKVIQEYLEDLPETRM